MKSFSDLNNFGQTTITVDDNRSSNVIFDRVPPQYPIDQVLTINSTSVSVDPGINITEIVNYSLANVRYQIKIVTSGSPTLIGSSISWASLPSGVTLSQVGTTYTLSGINTVEQWEAVKSFTWNLPSNYENFPQWFLEVSVLYYYALTNEEKIVDWEVYDDRFYNIAALSSAFSLTKLPPHRVRFGKASISAVSTQVTSVLRRKQFIINANSAFSVVAVGDKLVSKLASAFSLNITPTYNRKAAAAISASVSVYAKGTYKNGNLSAALSVVSTMSPEYNAYRVQIYHTTDQQTFTVDVTPTYGPFTVNWGDGTLEDFTGTAGFPYTITHTYTGTGYKDVSIVSKQLQGVVPKKLTSDQAYIHKVYDWGPQGPLAQTKFFRLPDQPYLTSVPNYLPTGSLIIQGMFKNCPLINDPNISNWNTSNVTNLYEVFSGATAFNQPLSSWDVSNVTNFESTFYHASASGFNQNLSAWNVSSGITFNGMFNGATAFQGTGIGSWNMSNANVLNGMFARAISFNTSIDTWNVSKVYDFSGMFYGATSFNQPLNSWTLDTRTTSPLLNIDRMFYGATSFNQAIDNWNTSRVRSMEQVFTNATSFNQSINSWNTANVTTMLGMFQGATSFNQTIASWNVSNVDSIDYMFNNASSYNKDLSALIFTLPAAPIDFATGATAWTLPKPTWNIV